MTRLVARRLDTPVDLQVPPGETERLFVVEKDGQIRIVKGGELVQAPFLDISQKVSKDLEQGLLGLAFHPRYGENGRFFIHYTDHAGDSHVAELRVSSDPQTADAASQREILLLPNDTLRHNSGVLQFGPDGKLYIGMGDASSGGDPEGHAQNLATLAGKILRIDVDAGSPYAVPPDNPFVGRAGARPEIWVYGLRNPWRLAIDRVTRDVLIGDVGQGKREEINLVPAGTSGQNFGWNIMEGTLCYAPDSNCQAAGLTPPLVEYPHREGCAVVAGPIYRGCGMPGYHGTFFYGDYCAGFVRTLRLDHGNVIEARDRTGELGRDLGAITSFGLDAEGEIYIVEADGEVHKIVPDV